jgi:acylphosphatase
MVARRCMLKGRVQGVGFRYFAYQTARAFLINGWVRNTPDGRVEIHAEGELDKLNEFLARISKGPTFASVDDVGICEVEPEGHHDFSIRG